MRVGILGAGRVGSALGVALSSAGLPVVLVGRTPPERSRASSLRLVSGVVCRPGPDLEGSGDPDALRDVDLCLLTVRSIDTEAAAPSLARALRADVPVVSFQNGLRNARRLRAHLGERPVVPGVVGFNVVRVERELRQTTRGPLVAGRPEGDAADRLAALARGLEEAGLPLVVRSDIRDVQAGKLLLNLNNGVCAVTGASIRDSVRSRALRRCFALLIEEGDRVLRAAGLHPRAVVGLSPRAIARSLRLPDLVVVGLGRAAARIEPEARSSTLADLLARRPTEIDELGGEVVRLAAERGEDAPRNRLVVELVHRLEAAGPPFSFVSPAELERRLRAVR